MNPIYNIDFFRLATWLLPPNLRTVFWLNWIKCLITPIILVYNNWIYYYNDITNRLNMNGQVCKLEGMLNDIFDPIDRKIYISDTPELEVILIHTDEAQTPVKTHQENQGQWYDDRIPIINDDSSYANSGYDFIVNVSVTLTKSQEIRMKSILNTYKLAGKRYKLLYT